MACMMPTHVSRSPLILRRDARQLLSFHRERRTGVVLSSAPGRRRWLLTEPNALLCTLPPPPITNPTHAILAARGQRHERLACDSRYGLWRRHRDNEPTGLQATEVVAPTCALLTTRPRSAKPSSGAHGRVAHRLELALLATVRSSRTRPANIEITHGGSGYMLSPR